MADEAKQRAALEVVAHLIEGGRTWKARAMSTTDSDIAARDAASRKDGSTAAPLVRLSEAEEALQQAALRYVSLFGELQSSIEANEVLRAEVAALRDALARVKNFGTPLANFAFNLAQHPGRSLNQRECGLIDLCRKDWDAAIDSALALAAKEAKP